MSYFEKRAEGKSPEEAYAEMPKYPTPKITAKITAKIKAKHIIGGLIGTVVAFILITD